MLVNLGFFFRLLAYFPVGTVGLVNRYHPGYIVKFLQESEKIPWAESICARLNMGNPYHSDLVVLPIEVRSCPRADAKDWTIIPLKDLDDPELMMREHFPIRVKSPVLFLNFFHFFLMELTLQAKIFFSDPYHPNGIILRSPAFVCGRKL